MSYYKMDKYNIHMLSNEVVEGHYSLCQWTMRRNTPTIVGTIFRSREYCKNADYMIINHI